ncbi:cysteine desulfurase-like protein [Solicola gregarius]|uniref:Cysteine desulfurase-like protein n=1 Tax=Solicola gregarius TaxID=2908642 RepID=A0AA46YKL6_9ACTN|nr:cysteine desulfurase-like protein [Solicola gregarius]UYM04709.1 cysteine desulfurase-like protein [Solicola gregarius]
MGFDVDQVRSQFPALAGGIAHFDGPGGSQTPEPVATAVAATLRSSISNRGQVSASERRADDVVTGARAAMADLLGADARGVVFGRSMTQLTYDFSRALAKGWRPGDEVVVTRLDHDANIRPWVQAAEYAGATLRWVDFDPGSGELDIDGLAMALSDKTRLVAVTAASNLIGTRPDVASIAEAVHAVGALLYVDGVHYTAHVHVDMAALGADVFACSPYKFLGPHCGVLAARPALLESVHPDKLLPATDGVPERFELGTLPYELLAGTTAAVDFLASLGEGATRRAMLRSAYDAIEKHEDALRTRLEAELADLPGVTLYSRAARRTPTLLFTVDGVAPVDVHRSLAERDINAPASSFYAIEAARRLGLGAPGAVRIGLAPYTDDDEIDRLVAGVRDLTAR